MSDRRALVDCVVLSLQDSCVFYPSCKSCVSRISVDQQDTARCRCSRCGCLCPREEIDYRYRLSLKVTRGTSIFGVTVFGNSLHSFFGIHATGLQRLVENPDGTVEPSVNFRLLLKAVKDCFIGRQFIFGIKLTETKHGPWTEGPVSSDFSSKDFAQFIASQMILPKAAGLEGCTVVSYYQALLQKLSDCSQDPADPNRSCRIPESPLVWNPSPSLTSSFHCPSLPAPGRLSQTLQRFWDNDCTLTPTPPWQQSLGVVTSSAEQEEGGGTQDSGHKNSGWTETCVTPPHVQRGCLVKPQVTDERPLLPPVELISCCSPFPPKNSSIQHFPGNSPILNTWFASSPAKETELSTRQLTGTLSSSLVALEDLPFSESLSEFICGRNKVLNVVREEESKGNAQCHKRKTRNDLESTTSTTEPTSTADKNGQPTEKHSQIFQDVTNTSAAHDDTQEFSKQVYQDLIGHENRIRARNICSREGIEENEETLSLEKEEKQLEGDTYNCSADLFSDSNIEMLNTNTETARTATERCSFFSKPNQQQLNENVTLSTPDKPKLKKSKCKDRNSLTLQDFVPPSQSTPIVKVKQSPSSQYRNSTDEFSSLHGRWNSSAFLGGIGELDSKKPTKPPSKSSKENLILSTTPNRYRPWNADEHKQHPGAGQSVRVQRRARSLRSMGPIHRKRDSRVCEVTECDNDDSEILVPPTPAGKMQMSVVIQRTNQSDSSCNHTFSKEVEQGCVKKTLLDPTVIPSHRSVAPTGHCDIGTSDDEKLNESQDHVLDDENRTCDWSRDLFSDSV